MLLVLTPTYPPPPDTGSEVATLKNLFFRGKPCAAPASFVTGTLEAIENVLGTLLVTFTSFVEVSVVIVTLSLLLAYLSSTLESSSELNFKEAEVPSALNVLWLVDCTCVKAF